MSWQVKQRVNFYLEEFHPPQTPGELKKIVWGVGAHLCLAIPILVGLYFYEGIQDRYLKEMESKNSQLEQRVGNLEGKRPPIEVSSELIQQRDTARQDLEGSRRILQYLTQQNLEKSYSFTQLVRGLGEKTIHGVWLSGFVISDKGGELTLKGYADDPAKVSITRMFVRVVPPSTTGMNILMPAPIARRAPARGSP